MFGEYAGRNKPFSWNIHKASTLLSPMVLQGAQQWFMADHIAETKAAGTGGPGEGIGKGKIISFHSM